MNKVCMVLSIVFLLSACSEQKKTEVPAAPSVKTNGDKTIKTVINGITYKLLFKKGYKKR
jgi:PBP1b-binding outer membrane lipoprotein LpoB